MWYLSFRYVLEFDGFSIEPDAKWESRVLADESDRTDLSFPPSPSVQKRVNGARLILLKIYQLEVSSDPFGSVEA